MSQQHTHARFCKQNPSLYRMNELCVCVLLSELQELLAEGAYDISVLIQVHLSLPQHVNQHSVTDLVQHHLLRQLRTQPETHTRGREDGSQPMKDGRRKRTK